jgi:hypothetical protein
LLPCVLLSVVMLSPVFASGSAEADELEARRALIDELSVEELTFGVVVAAVVAPEASAQERIALGSYVQVVRDIAVEVPDRALSEEERTALARYRIAERRSELRRTLDNRRRGLERERLTAVEPEPDLRPYQRDQSIRSTHENLERLAAISPAEPVTPERVPVAVDARTYTFRRILPTAAGLAKADPDAHLTLFLRVERLGDERLVRLFAYHRWFERTTEVFRVVAPPELVTARIEERRPDLVRAIAGRSPARLTVESLDQARIYLDGRFYGLAPVQEPYLDPGFYEIRAELPDGRAETRRVALAPGEDRRLYIPIDAPPPATVTIRSRPSGARVYRGSLWQGFTPVEVPRPETDTAYVVASEGYFDSRVTVGPDSPDEIERTLFASDRDWEAEVESARDRFYRSFGAFALSTAAPIILNGIYRNYVSLAAEDGVIDRLTPREQERVTDEANLVFYGYYAGLSLSVGLFGNMIWRLVGYVNVAQEYHTR